MRTEAEILIVILNAKAFFTKQVQNIATILETRLLNEEEQLAELNLQSLSLQIQSIENGYLNLEQKNLIADHIIENQNQIDYKIGQSYVENNYTNDYVVFEQ
jgi:hypothetical protein